MKIFDKKNSLDVNSESIRLIRVKVYVGMSIGSDGFFLQKKNVFSFREKILFVFKLSTKMVCFVEIFGIVKKGSVCCINIVDLSKISPDEE